MQHVGPNRRRAATLAAMVAVLLVCLVPFGGAASAADQVISHTFVGVVCDANVNGTHIVQSQDVTVGFIVPDQVAPGATFTVTFPGGSALLPSTSNGLTITSYSNLSLTYQIKNALFVPGSIVNPGTSTLDPTGPGSNLTLTQTSVLLAGNDKIANGTPGPFPPGTLTTPTITVDAVAPASGDVTLNAFELTTTVKLNGLINAAVICAIPTDTLATIPVVAGTSSTTTASTTTTTAPPTTTTTASTTTTTAPPTTTTTASTTTVPATTSSTAASTSTTVASENCLPGNGFGDKNHCHSGPPGLVKKGEGPRSIAARLIDARPGGPSGLALTGLVIALGLFGIGLYGPRRRRA